MNVCTSSIPCLLVCCCHDGGGAAAFAGMSGVDLGLDNTVSVNTMVTLFNESTQEVRVRKKSLWLYPFFWFLSPGVCDIVGGFQSPTLQCCFFMYKLSLSLSLSLSVCLVPCVGLCVYACLCKHMCMFVSVSLSLSVCVSV